MHPRQLATIDNITGSITLTAIDSEREANAMLSGALVFSGEPLGLVLQRLGNAYGRTFDLRADVEKADVFTGFLPTDNLEEALDVLETSYHLRAEVQGHIITLE